jgi:hypothetical protein
MPDCCLRDGGRIGSPGARMNRTCFSRRVDRCSSSFSVALETERSHAGCNRTTPSRHPSNRSISGRLGKLQFLSGAKMPPALLTGHVSKDRIPLLCFACTAPSLELGRTATTIGSDPAIADVAPLSCHPPSKRLHHGLMTC